MEQLKYCTCRKMYNVKEAERKKEILRLYHAETLRELWSLDLPSVQSPE